VLQDAVNAVFDGDFGVARFDVDVTGAALERREDDSFDEFDDGAGGCIARDAIAGKRFLCFLFDLARLKREGFGGLLENTLRLFRALKKIADLPGCRDLNGKLLTKKKLQLVCERDLAWFGNGDGKHVVLNFEGNEVVAEHQVGLDGAKKFRVNALLAQIYERKTVTLGEPAGMFSLVQFFGAEGRRAVYRGILLRRSHEFRSNRRRSFRSLK